VNFVEVYPQTARLDRPLIHNLWTTCGNPYRATGDRVVVEEVIMNGTSYRLEMAQQMLATLAQAEERYGRTATTSLRALVARTIANLLV